MDWFMIFIPIFLFGGMGLFFGCLIPLAGIVEFSAFCSWWWPFRDESAATLAAAALDIDQGTIAWCEHGYENECLSSTALDTTIMFDQFDGFRLTVAGQQVPLTIWDCFKLFWATTRWQMRHDRLSRKRANNKAAARAKDYLKSISERTVA